jgi:hypothetical protein
MFRALIFGVSMLSILSIAGLVAYHAVMDKSEKNWFRVVELVASVILCFIAVLLSSQR